MIDRDRNITGVSRRRFMRLVLCGAAGVCAAPLAALDVSTGGEAPFALEVRASCGDQEAVLGVVDILMEDPEAEGSFRTARDHDVGITVSDQPACISDRMRAG